MRTGNEATCGALTSQESGCLLQNLTAQGGVQPHTHTVHHGGMLAEKGRKERTDFITCSASMCKVTIQDLFLQSWWPLMPIVNCHNKLLKRRLSVTNLSSENNLQTFRLNAPVVIRVKVKRCKQTLLFIAMHYWGYTSLEVRGR